MKWINVSNQDEIPKNKRIIVEDCNYWIGQAFWTDGGWQLETFGQGGREIYFDEIVRYLILD